MRTNGKCNNSHALSTGLSAFLLSVELNIPEGQEYEKILTLYECTGRSFAKMTAVATSK